jgi:hypothetical protein
MDRTLPDPDLVGRTISVHYAQPGSKTISAGATFQGKVLVAVSGVNVVRPTITGDAIIPDGFDLLHPNDSFIATFGGNIEFTSTVDQGPSGNVGAGY